MWILLLRRAPTGTGTSLVKGGLLGSGLILGHERTNEWMRLGCRTPPPPRLYHGGRPLFRFSRVRAQPGGGTTQKRTTGIHQTKVAGGCLVHIVAEEHARLSIIWRC